MKKVFNEFKKFISKGNIIDLAVAVIIGAAFGKIVTSLVNDIIMPLISLIFTACGLKGFEAWKWEILDKHKEVAAILAYGNFLRTILDFFIIALCIFFVYKIIKGASGKTNAAVKKFKDRKSKPAAEEPVPEVPAAEVAPAEPTTNELLIQIRDLLISQQNQQKAPAAEKDNTGKVDKA